MNKKQIPLTFGNAVPTTEQPAAKPYEMTRWSISDFRGVFVGYVSRYYYDHRSHWRMWNDEGVNSEISSLQAGMRLWNGYKPGISGRVQ